MWWHLSTFYDSTELGVAYATVTTASALNGLVGGPLAALFLSFNGLGGLHGWQWCVPHAAGCILRMCAACKWCALTRPCRRLLCRSTLVG